MKVLNVLTTENNVGIHQATTEVSLVKQKNGASKDNTHIDSCQNMQTLAATINYQKRLKDMKSCLSLTLTRHSPSG